MSDFNIIAQRGKLTKENILKSFLLDNDFDLNQLEKGGKPMPIGTRVERKNGVTEEKQADGSWKPVKKDHQHADEQHSTSQPAQEQTASTRSSSDHPYGHKRPSNEQLAGAVRNVLNNNKTMKGKIMELYKIGCSKDEIVNCAGAKLSDVNFYIKDHHKRLEEAGGTPMPNANRQSSQSQSTSSNDDKDFTIPLDYEELPEISTEDKWNSYELFGTMLCLKQGKSMIAYGSGGVGKSYTLMGKNQIFDKYGMKAFDEEISEEYKETEEEPNEDEDEDTSGEDNPRMASGIFLDKNSYDYIKVTGKVTAPEMYKMLMEHNGKVVVFDDCDSVLKDDNAVNILKGALDTSGDGTISYKVAGDVKTMYANIVGARKKPGKNGAVEYILPKRFKFTGQVVFISNLSNAQMPQALISRALNVDLTMNADETSERLQQIYPHMNFQDPEGNELDVSLEDKKAAADFIHKYRHALNASDLNARTLGKIALMKKTATDMGGNFDWKKAAISMLTKKK
jgi:hypothetical protein